MTFGKYAMTLFSLVFFTPVVGFFIQMIGGAVIFILGFVLSIILTLFSGQTVDLTQYLFANNNLAFNLMERGVEAVLATCYILAVWKKGW